MDVPTGQGIKIMPSLGKKIQHYRRQKGFSLRELAAHAKISHSFISDIEHERSLPSITTLNAIADALDIPVTYFLGNEQINPEEKIKDAIKGDEDLLSFWDVLAKRDDLQLLFKQTKNLPPETIRRIIKYIKLVEDEEATEDL